MATAPTYCTHRQLKDIFPQVNSFDSKRPIYGWVQESQLDGNLGTNVDIWFAYNTGLVTELFQDGIEMTNITSNLDTKKTQLNGEMAVGATGATFDSTTGMEAEDIIKIDNEYMEITAIASGTVIATASSRGEFNTHQVVHADESSVYLILDETAVSNTDFNLFWYDINLDMCVVAVPSSGNPNDKLMEAGEDFTTLVTRTLGNASRYLDSRLDPNLPQNQFKDKEGNYDYLIVRTTALIASSFMIRSHDATSEVATTYMEEVDKNIELLNTGKASLSWQTTGDSSRGVIRDVTYTSGSVRPVDLRGRASGIDYDLIKVSISASTAGVIGTAKYNVYVKDSTGLKTNQVVTEEVITGDYQSLAHGLEIRFSGSTDSSVATASNEWEVECMGYSEEIDNANVRSIKATRGGKGIYGRYNRKSY